MRQEEIIKLKVNDKVIIDSDSDDLNHLAKVVCIDDWRKKIGVVSFNGDYFEFPYRLIKKKVK